MFFRKENNVEARSYAKISLASYLAAFFGSLGFIVYLYITNQNTQGFEGLGIAIVMIIFMIYGAVAIVPSIMSAINIAAQSKIPAVISIVFDAAYLFAHFQVVMNVVSEIKERIDIGEGALEYLANNCPHLLIWAVMLILSLVAFVSNILCVKNS